jgi:hypothetical protein
VIEGMLEQGARGDEGGDYLDSELISLTVVGVVRPLVGRCAECCFGGIDSGADGDGEEGHC